MYENYERVRNSQGLTDYAVAKACGIGRATLSDWKSGKHTPNRENLNKIADFLNVSVDYLIGRSENDGAYYVIDEVAEMAQMLYERPELKVLMDSAADLSKEEIQAIVTLVGGKKDDSKSD